MARLRKETVRARLTHTLFDCPIRPYTMSLADYFMRDHWGTQHYSGGRASTCCPAATVE
ncbi:hypothetical protein AAG906_017274 [Vitis piasezkii]